MIDEDRNPQGPSEDELWEALETAVGSAKVDTLLELSEIAYRSNRNSDSVTLAEQAVTEAENGDDIQARGRAYEILGRRLYAVDRNQEASDFHLKAAECFAQFDNHRDTGQSYLHASWAFEACEESEAALTAVNTAISFMEGTGFVPGNFYVQRADALKAIDADEAEIFQALSDARQAFRSLEDAENVLRIDDRVATMLLDNGETASAVSLLEDCLSVSETINRQRFAYFSYRYGTALNCHGEPSNALQALKQSLEINLEVETVRNVGAIYYEMSQSYIDLNEYEEALQYVKKARAFFDMGGDDAGKWNAEARRAYILHLQHEYEQAAEVNQTIADNWQGFARHMALARRADNLRQAGQLEEALKAAGPFPDEHETDFYASTSWLWREAVRALILAELGRVDEAQQIACDRLDSVVSDASGWVQAVFHELRGNWKQRTHFEDQAQADWARAVALYLSAGFSREAARLSKAFLPSTGGDAHQ